MTDNQKTEPGFLLRYFRANQKRQIYKWTHYFEIYERHLSRFCNSDATLLEIGVAHGGSLQMWKQYLGPKARIVGVDNKERCRELAEDQIEIFIGDQSNREFLAELRSKVAKVDILIDDGGHFMQQQIATFQELFPHVSSDGVYICEDLHTNYWESFGGGLRKQGSFIEVSKQLIDHLHGWYSQDPQNFGVSAFTKSVYALHYYTSVLVIEKRLMQPPQEERHGKESF